ncbi:armadillo-type protein [Lipomyces arxii]|uniref:armadillo-type protein n=1 Tax=Lipomyces arxii TaxID=56418 RepID=UPI0034D0104F
MVVADRDAFDSAKMVDKSPYADVFQQVKAICVPLSQLALTLTKDAGAENKFKIVNSLEDLHHTLGMIPPELYSAQLGDYIFFPLSHLLRLHEKLDDRTTELLLRCLAVLIKHSWGKNLSKELAKQLCILIVYFIDDTGTQKSKIRHRVVSDESKAAGCLALKVLFSAVAPSKALSEMFNDSENIPMLAHTISVILDSLLKSEDLSCEVEAVEALQTLLVSAIADGDIVATFFPGVISTLCKVMTRSIKKTHYTVLSKTIELFGQLTSITFSDADLVAIIDTSSPSVLSIESFADSLSPDSGKSSTDSNETMSQRDPKQLRSKSWLQGTKHQFKMSLEPFTKLRSHSRPEVRMEVRNVCEQLLQSSFYCLDNCRSTLLVTLIFLSGDSNYDISFESFDFVRTLGNENKEVVNLVRDGVYQWVTSLQHTLNIQDETRQLSMLMELQIAIDLMLDWEADLSFLQDAFISNFLLAVRLNSPGARKVITSNVATSFDITRLTSGTDAEFVRQKNGTIEFRSSVRAKSLESLAKVLENMGASALSRDFAEECSEIVFDTKSSMTDQQTALWMFIHMVKGAKNAIELIEDPDISLFVAKSAEQLDSIAMGHLTSQLDTDDLTQDQITMVQLSLDGLSLAANIMGEGFRLSLIEDIYPVLNLVAAPQWPVRQYAYICLNNISVFTGYSSISEFLVDNVDYVLDQISLKLNTLDISPRTPKILSVLIRLAGYSAVPYLDDIVASIFQLLDNFHGYSRLVEGFFEVLKTIVEQTAEACNVSLLTIEYKPRREKPGIWDLESLLADLARKPEFKLHECENDDFVDSDDDEADDGAKGFREFLKEREQPKVKEDEDMPPPEEEEKWKSPVAKPWYMIIKRIVDLTKYYLTHSSTSIRYQIFDLLTIGLPVLATSQKNLLPTINDLWPQVVLQLGEKDMHIVIASLKVLSKFSECSGDFMTARFEQVWPKIKRLIPNEIPRRVEGKFSVPAQVLAAVLECVTAVVSHTRLDEKVFLDVLDAVAPFLKYDDHLRNAMEEVSSDAVWLCMNV